MFLLGIVTSIGFMAANDDLKKINRGTISLREIKEILEIVNNKVGKLETHVGTHSTALYVMKDQQSVMNEKLDTIESKLEELSENVDAARGDIELLHTDVKGIRDDIGLWHQRDKREIDEIKTHLGLPLMPDTPAV